MFLAVWNENIWRWSQKFRLRVRRNNLITFYKRNVSIILYIERETFRLWAKIFSVFILPCAEDILVLFYQIYRPFLGLWDKIFKFRQKSFQQCFQKCFQDKEENVLVFFLAAQILLLRNLNILSKIGQKICGCFLKKTKHLCGRTNWICSRRKGFSTFCTLSGKLSY